jgi:hypothetical protein
MYRKEFQIGDLGAELEEGLGHLLVTDAGLLVKPAVPGQYHQVPLDTAHFAQVMDVGDVTDGWGDITWHVVTSMPAQEAHSQLDRGWYAYFDGYCMGKVWIDATVNYIGADSRVIRTAGYGFSDGERRAVVYVYCREYWESLGNPDPAQCDWTDLISTHVTGSNAIHGPIPLDKLEEVLGEGLPYVIDWGGQKLIVVRPSDDPLGFTARGFHLIEIAVYED